MTTSSPFSGTLIWCLQLGHGPDLPANLSLTWNRLKHLGQVTWIGMSDEQRRGEDGAIRGHSVSRGDEPPQPAKIPQVVLYQPEIPQNTGNIGRTCVAVGAQLWIVQPCGFRLDEKRLRRAGLDYWRHLRWQLVADWETLVTALPGRPRYYFSRFARRTLWEAEFRPGDVFVFGSESSGLPTSILDPEDDQALRLPTSEEVRSLNLATTVGIALYEYRRQVGW